MTWTKPKVNNPSGLVGGRRGHKACMRHMKGPSVTSPRLAVSEWHLQLAPSRQPCPAAKAPWAGLKLREPYPTAPEGGHLQDSRAGPKVLWRDMPQPQPLSPNHLGHCPAGALRFWRPCWPWSVAQPLRTRVAHVLHSHCRGGGGGVWPVVRWVCHFRGRRQLDQGRGQASHRRWGELFLGSSALCCCLQILQSSL